MMSHLSTHKTVLSPRVLAAIPLFFSLLVTLALGRSGAGSEEANIFSKCWEYKIDVNSGVGLGADASGAYFLDSENKLHAAALATGNKLWSSELGGEVVSNLLVIEDMIFVATTTQPEAGSSGRKTLIWAISRQTGITAWLTDIAASSTVWLGASGSSIVVVGSNGLVTSLVRADGRSLWNTELKAEVSAAPNFTENGIELGTTKKELLRISITGRSQVVWRSEFLPTAVLTDAGGRLLIGDERGNLTSVSADGNRSWRFRNGAQISSTSLYDSEYIATSHDNFVYKISRDGDVKWKRRLSGRIADGPILLGDTAVFSTVGTGGVYALDLRNGKISNRIETGDEVSLRLAAAKTEQSGFIIGAPGGISYYSSKCPRK